MAVIITKDNAEIALEMFYGILSRAVSKEMFTRTMCAGIELLKLLPFLLGPNWLIYYQDLLKHTAMHITK